MIISKWVSGAYNPAEWKEKKADKVRAMFGILFSLLHDEKCQINGFVFLSDFTSLTLAHQTFYSIEEMNKIIKYWHISTTYLFINFVFTVCFLFVIKVSDVIYRFV